MNNDSRQTTETARQQGQERESSGNSAEYISIPALRHVGPTLESDPAYLARESSGGDSTPEAQIASEGASPDSLAGRDATDLAADITGRYDSSSAGGESGAGGPEPLRTRLPGDTSSDPHTDLGPDNATSVQHRGEREGEK